MSGDRHSPLSVALSCLVIYPVTSNLSSPHPHSRFPTPRDPRTLHAVVQTVFAFSKPGEQSGFPCLFPVSRQHCHSLPGVPCHENYYFIYLILSLRICPSVRQVNLVSSTLAWSEAEDLDFLYLLNSRNDSYTPITSSLTMYVLKYHLPLYSIYYI